MNEQVSSTKSNSQGIIKDKRFITALILIALILGYVLLLTGKDLFISAFDHLPLLLPIVVTFLSILTRASDLRNYEAILKISNDIAIGIISFDIWAISAKSSDSLGRVVVSQTKMIDGNNAILLLVSGIVLAVGCVVITYFPFKESLKKQRTLLVILLASIIVYIIPFGLIEPIKKSDRYTVFIPYKDSVITSMAPTVLKDKLFFKLKRDIIAKSHLQADSIAVDQFLSSKESNNFERNKNDRGKKVEVQKSEVLVFEQKSETVPVK